MCGQQGGCLQTPAPMPSRGSQQPCPEEPYLQLVAVEEAFKNLKWDLPIRPISINSIGASSDAALRSHVARAALKATCVSSARRSHTLAGE